jgi:hypothetical protein
LHFSLFPELSLIGSELFDAFVDEGLRFGVTLSGGITVVVVLGSDGGGGVSSTGDGLCSKISRLT